MDIHGGSPSGHGVAVTGADGKFDIGGIGGGRTIVKVLPSRDFDGSSPLEAGGADLLRISIRPRGQ